MTPPIAGTWPPTRSCPHSALTRSKRGLEHRTVRPDPRGKKLPLFGKTFPVRSTLSVDRHPDGPRPGEELGGAQAESSDGPGFSRETPSLGVTATAPRHRAFERERAGRSHHIRSAATELRARRRSISEASASTYFATAVAARFDLGLGIGSSATEMLMSRESQSLSSHRSVSMSSRVWPRGRAASRRPGLQRRGRRRSA